MKSRPILFSTEMVQAILAGRKTQTRRPVKPPYSEYPCVSKHITSCEFDFYVKDGIGQFTACPYGKPGDQLWVKETFAFGMTLNGWKYTYKADGPPPYQAPYGLQWKPSIFLPKNASRITLEIIDIRVERLLGISEEDAKAEGVKPGRVLGLGAIGKETYREGFISKWGDIHGDKYGLNPWVWVIEFKRIDE